MPEAPLSGSPLLALFRAWDALHRRINDEATPEQVAQQLYDSHRALQERIMAQPSTSLVELAAKVLALTEHGTMEPAPELVEECEAIVAPSRDTASDIRSGN